MKIVVVSDNHGLIRPLEQIQALHHDAAAFIHCGDSELSPDYLKDWICVGGNNDYFYEYPQEQIIDVQGVKCFITHGHRYFRPKIVEESVRRAINNHCQVVCYGHLHIYQAIEQSGVLVVNPGSIRYNRDMSKPCYAVIYYEQGKFRVERCLVEDLG